MTCPRARRQSGLATVEFAVVAAAFLVILFGAIEMSRLLFTWNALGAITQRGARLAAVCPPGDPGIARVAAFRGTDDAGGLLLGLSEENLSITYLDEHLADTGGAFPIRFVRARIVDYHHRAIIPFVPGTLLPSPEFSTTLPAESLGYVPGTGGRSCFGA